MFDGEMSEWFKEHAWKACGEPMESSGDPLLSGQSNDSIGSPAQR